VKKWAALASALLLSLWLSFGALCSALGRYTPSQSSPFVLPIVKRDSLLNGLHLITLEQQNTGTVAAHLRINSGGLFDLAGKGGLADLTAGMLLKGCGGLNAKNVADTIEQLGMTVSITTGRCLRAGSALISSSTSKPFFFGMLMSSSTSPGITAFWCFPLR